MRIYIDKVFQKEAKEYAIISKSFTSKRHDFYEGGLSDKQRTLFEGKLGEKAIKQFFIDHKIKFKEDQSSHDEADFYDFMVYDLKGNELKVEVKTRTKISYIRTLESVEQMKNNPKDIYFSVKLYNTKPFCVDVIGYGLKEDFLSINRIENKGDLDNYVLYDKELKNPKLIIPTLQKI